jgi:hypothetical protein
MIMMWPAGMISDGERQLKDSAPDKTTPMAKVSWLWGANWWDVYRACRISRPFKDRSDQKLAASFCLASFMVQDN